VDLLVQSDSQDHKDSQAILDLRGSKDFPDQLATLVVLDSRVMQDLLEPLEMEGVLVIQDCPE